MVVISLLSFIVERSDEFELMRKKDGFYYVGRIYIEGKSKDFKGTAFIKVSIRITFRVVAAPFSSK